MRIVVDLARRFPAVMLRLRRDRRGTVAILFALSVAPLIFLVGSALDYSGAAHLRTNLQKATDGTGLNLCQMPIGSSVAELRTQAQKMLTGYLGDTSYTVESLTTTTNPWTVDLTTRSQFPTAIMKALSSNFTFLPVGAEAKCFGQPQTFEIALVLDNTGSMSQSGGGTSKIQALRQSATDFVNYIFSSPKMKDVSRISLVPFAAGVALDPSTFKNASWIDQSGSSPTHWSFLQGGKTAAAAAGWTSRFDLFAKLKSANGNWDWTGCFETLPYSSSDPDVKPSASDPGSYYVPMLAADESGAGGENPFNPYWGHKDGKTNNPIVSINSYIDDESESSDCQPVTDEMTRTGRACKYAAMANPKSSNGVVATGPNALCTTRPLTRLTRNQSAILSEISQMGANGYTNIHQGLMWGWRTLSPLSVLSSAPTQDQTPAEYTKEFNNKIIVLMTDGTNTWNYNQYNALKSIYSAYGYVENPDGTKAAARVGSSTNPSSDSSTRAAIDGLTRQACAAVAAKQIKIYTIGFSTPSDPIDGAGLSLLSDCAGDPSRAFVANDSSGLQDAFDKVAQSIGNLRITN